ncbi:hypothetical protein FNF28_03233 [Cafeteria roenbergensis]|uniref:EF-hand domain-containing protein n=1 Tax=Cafeteria roenbergensis TaxID=33653 RepID=A0A5A8DLB7_CAFRO|nr:hypothetical protein FNF28_03233 [Cafeteria roenbergensis]
MSGDERLRKQAEAEERFRRKASLGGSRSIVVDPSGGAGDPTAEAAPWTTPGSPLGGMDAASSAARGPADKATAAFASSIGSLTQSAAAASLSAPWRRPDHALSRRRDASRWADPARSTELETGLSGAAGAVSAAVSQTGHREDWSSAALHARFRDESVRFEAWVQSRAAAEEAARVEEDTGVVMPVAVSDPHPVWSWSQSLVARENASARKLARARALRKVYSLDVRAVWLAGDLPIEAPLPWRAEPYGGDGGGRGRGAAGRASAEEVVARRALAGRRDDAALRAGHHQIQSVSLRRAMQEAVVTPVADAADVQRSERIASVRVVREVPIDRAALRQAQTPLDPATASAGAGRTDPESAAEPAEGPPVAFFDEGRRVASPEVGEADGVAEPPLASPGRPALSAGHPAEAEEGEAEEDDGAANATMLGRGRAAAVTIEAEVDSDRPDTAPRMLRARVPIDVFAEVVRREAEAALPALEDAAAEAAEAHQAVMTAIAAARDRRAVAAGDRPEMAVDPATPARNPAEADARPQLEAVPETATAALGFRLWERVAAARPAGDFAPSAFGVSRGSAVPNAASLWPRRFTWHSSAAIRTGLSHGWKDFLYILENRTVSSGPNEATTFTTRMDFERCARVDSASLRAIRELERRNEEQRAELRRRADEAARMERAAERKARKARARAELARQWREKHIRDAARLRGSAPTLGLSEADWHAMRSGHGAEVTARHLGWERWIQSAPREGGAGPDEAARQAVLEGRGADVAGLGEDVVAVWYHHPESGASGWDPPDGWPEEDALAAEGASLEDAVRAAAAEQLVVAAVDLPEAMDAARREEEDAVLPADVTVASLMGARAEAGFSGSSASAGARGDEALAPAAPAAQSAWLLPTPAVLSSAEAAAACEEVVVRSLLFALRAWLAEAASRGCVDPGRAFKPPIANPAGGRESDPGDEDGSHAQRALDAAERVVAAGQARLDPVRRLARRGGAGRGGQPSAAAGGEQGDDGYDDGDIAGMDCGIEPGSGGEGRAGGAWRAGAPSDRFDMASVFLFLDRDGDGAVSARDWAVLLTGEGGGAGAGAQAARALPAADRVAGEVVRAALWPHFRAALGRLTPPALRPLLATRVPSLVDEDAVAAMTGGDGGSAPVAVSQTVKARLERGEDPDGVTSGRSAAALLASLMTPAVRMRAFRAVKRQRAFFPREEDADKRPQLLRHDELVRWVAGAAEGSDWFGVSTTSGLHAPVATWGALGAREAVAQAAAEWVPAIDPASGEAYYSSSLTGASVWEKGAPQLQAEAALRRAVVAALDTEARSQEAQYRSGLRRARDHAERLRRRRGGPSDRAGGAREGAGAGADGAGSGAGTADSQGASLGAVTAESVARALAGDDALVRALAQRLGLPVPAPAPQQAGVGAGVGAGAGAGAGALADRAVPGRRRWGAGEGRGAADGGDAESPRFQALRTADGGGGGVRDLEGAFADSLPGAVEWDEEEEEGAEGGGQDARRWGGEAALRGGSASLGGRAGPAGGLLVDQAGGGAGLEWRQLKPPREARRLRARAKESHVLGAGRSEGVNKGNVSRVVGLVAPRDVTVAPTVIDPPFIIPVLVTDITAAAGEAGLTVTIDPRTGARVVKQAAEADEEGAEARAQEKALADAFSAVRAGRLEALRDILVTGMVNINDDRDDAGNSLFHLAAQNGNKRLCKELLRKGADINSKNSKGNTALHYCFAYGFPELGEYLVSKGADDTIANGEGVAPREGLTTDAVGAI